MRRFEPRDDWASMSESAAHFGPLPLHSAGVRPGGLIGASKHPFCRCCRMAAAESARVVLKATPRWLTNTQIRYLFGETSRFMRPI